MSDNIVGADYGVEVEADVAQSLLVDEEGAAQSTEQDSQPNGEEATIDEQTQETEQLVQTEDAPTTEEVTSVEIDGKEYSLEELKTFQEDSKNRSEWFKSNTQKAQENAAERKSLEQERAQWDELRKDSELMDTLKDYLGEDHSLFTKPKVVEPSEVTTQDTKESSEVDDKLTSRIQELEDKLEEQQATQQLERDISALVRNHPELEGQDDAVKEVLNTAYEKQMTNLEDAFVLTNHKAAENSAFAKAVKKLEEANAKKSIPEASVKHKGDQSVTNAKPKNFDEARDMALKYELYA